MPGEYFIGGEAKLYYNAGTYASPTWTLIDNCIDLDMPDARNAVGAVTRGTWPYMGYIPGSRDVSLTWNSLQRQETTDTVLTALIAAYDAGTVTEFAVADQAIATVGCKYRRLTCIITKCDESEPIDGVVTLAFEAKPALNNAGNNPSRATISA